jgi:hypothetical protein
MKAVPSSSLGAGINAGGAANLGSIPIARLILHGPFRAVPVHAVPPAAFSSGSRGAARRAFRQEALPRHQFKACVLSNETRVSAWQ